jgi:hypothetical protein
MQASISATKVGRYELRHMRHVQYRRICRCQQDVSSRAEVWSPTGLRTIMHGHPGITDILDLDAPSTAATSSTSSATTTHLRRSACGTRPGQNGRLEGKRCSCDVGVAVCVAGPWSPGLRCARSLVRHAPSARDSQYHAKALIHPPALVECTVLSLALPSLITSARQTACEADASIPRGMEMDVEAVMACK